MLKSTLTPGDKGLIAFFVLSSLGFIFYQWFFLPQPAAKAAEVRVNGQLIQTLPLRAGYTRQMRIGGEENYAVIEASDGKVRIYQDDSPRQIGVQTGWISQSQQQIINLPYRIVVTVTSSAPPEIDAIVR